MPQKDSAPFLPLRPYQVISLWDMLQYPGKKIGDLYAVVYGMVQHTETDAKIQSYGTAEIWKTHLRTYVLEEAQALHLGAVVRYVSQTLDNLAKWISNPTELRNEIRAIERILRNEISVISFVYIPETAAQYLDWQSIFKKSAPLYTNINHEMEHACRCFAMESYSASVFHLMRMLEAALRKFESALNIPEEKDRNKQSWQNILTRIGNEIRTRNEPKNITPSWEKQREFYESGRAFLAAIKQAWRNDHFHSIKQFDPVEAKVVFDAAVYFVEHLTNKFKTLAVR